MGGSGQGQLMPMLVLVLGPELQGANVLCHPWFGREEKLGSRHLKIWKMPWAAPASSLQSKRDPQEEVGTALLTALTTTTITLPLSYRGQ